MRSTACDDVCVLIDREAIGWTEAERLRVEQHLSECASCSETLGVSRFVRDTLMDAAAELPESARARAIKGALSESGRRRSLRVRAQNALPLWSVGLSLAAAAALLVWLVREPESQPTARSTPAVQTASPKNVLATKEPTASRPVAMPESGSVESQGRETHTFAHATVLFAPSTQTRFDAATNTLSLERGEIDVDVDASKGQLFTVLTRQFRVEVLGTRFSVTNETVTVQHGHVRVLGLSGAVLAHELSAGQTFTLSSDAGTTAKSAASAPRVSASSLLSQARSALSRDDRQRARELVRAAENARPTRAERAEAGTLHAELALLEQKAAEALRFYREVARLYPELSAGENAAFAAAQLAIKVAPEEARALLDGYLARYPSGRFVDQAKQRLRRLDAR